MTDLSPSASAVWEAFNQDEAGVFVDYGDKLAAALRAAAKQLAQIATPHDGMGGIINMISEQELLKIAAELEGD